MSDDGHCSSIPPFCKGRLGGVDLYRHPEPFDFAQGKLREGSRENRSLPLEGFARQASKLACEAGGRSNRGEGVLNFRSLCMKIIRS
jgi:hypothetical protein